MWYKPSPGLRAAGGFRTHPRYRGCVAHWLMDEGGGLTAFDISGNKNNGTLTSGPTWTGGQFGPTLNLDGVDDYVDVGNASPLQLTGAMTVSAWINLDDLSATVHRIVSKFGLAGNRGWEMVLDDAPDNRFTFRISSDGTVTLQAQEAAQWAFSGQWMHVVGTYEPSTALRIYRNAVLIVENTTAIPASQFNSSVNARIGRGPTGGAPFDGKIDDVRIYNRVLSPEEVAWLYNQPFIEFYRARHVFVSTGAAAAGQPYLSRFHAVPFVPTYGRSLN